ncbi:MAG: translation initiation factor IF-3 [bacterium]
MQKVRVNERIKVPKVRVVGADGVQIGIIDTREAIARAKEAGLDLVEVAPVAEPPVCKIMDYGKYKYEEAKKEKAAKKKAHAFHLKELTLRPKIEEHDYQVKLKHLRKFLSAHSRVKITVKFRGREMAHLELGKRVLDRLVHDCDELASVEQSVKVEGRHMVIVLAPKVQKK